MKIDSESWIRNKPIAHRGLWNDDAAENSMGAFENAIAHGYAIETDIYMTADGEIVCFHDDCLNRMTDCEDFIWEKTFAQLQELKIGAHGEQIPSLKQLLDLCDGRTPLLIEFKDQPDNNALVEKAVALLKNYRGEFAVQAFNPFILRKIKKLAPEFTRGILGTPRANKKSFITNFIIKNMSLNLICNPDFISYDYQGLPLLNRKVKGRPVLMWTISDEAQKENYEDFSDNFIFEKYLPLNK